MAILDPSFSILGIANHAPFACWGFLSRLWKGFEQFTNLIQS
jgi:hypothetical protein